MIYFKLLPRYCSLLMLLPFLSWSASHHPQDFLKKIANTPQEGEQIAQHYCATCHAKTPLIPLGAPRMGVLKDWQPRLAQNLDLFLEHTNEGFNAMPARGGCFECTDRQLILAIAVMLPEISKKRFLSKLKEH